MDSPERVHAHAQSRDTRTDHSQQIGQGGSGARAEVSDHGSKTLAIIALVVSCAVSSIALGAVAMFVAMQPRTVDAEFKRVDDRFAAERRIAEAQFTTLRADFARTERESKIMAIEVQNQSALLLREGIKLPTDSEHGPGSNLSYRPRGK